MRTFLTFLACSGFIVWAHSCDTRILGVQPGPEKQEPLVVKQVPPSKPAQRTLQEEYIRTLVSAAALTIADNTPASLVSLRRLHRNGYLSPNTDTLLLRFKPQQHIIQ